ncbi:hypothetical protein HUT16_17860 [Kitasatospora sp. NA04385]|uniref:hypothetical protein n=1 Tax=Kitasatospora sp. NA04385 TaxID=2742135 RepID=UPI001591B4DB|nr:hypothetical protein [Kitasatospora sp. NA04385]QKW20687.1 hypothetical protein HUT16_17860 [Kitasatospora sp. NA04385]
MNESTIALHELSFVPEGDEVLVGRLDTGSYAVFPADGAQLLRRLTEGMPLDAAAEWYEETFEEAVDVEDFLDTIRELGFVRETGDERAEPAAPVGLRRLGRAAFSAPAWVCYLAVVLLWLLALTRYDGLRPDPSQVFFVKSLLVVQLVITFGQVPLLLAHEGFHILAGRRLGLPTKLRLSNRLTYIVAETETNGLLSVERRKRYLPFLAGMLCDAVVLAGLGLAALAGRHADGSFSTAGRLCLALAFTVVMRIVWQFQLYLRTDLYYVFATALGCYDLHEAAKAVLRNRIWRRLGRPERQVDESGWTAQDRRVGAFYGPFIVLGFCTLAAITVFASIPVTLEYLRIAARALGSGRVDARFWDSALSLLLNAAQVATLIVLARRKRREQRRPLAPAAPGAVTTA